VRASSPASDAVTRGTRLLLELGRGGMGIVYLALTRGPGGFTKLKVIKRLRPEIAGEPRALQMFLDEARLAARLLHPNIVQTNEVGFDGKNYFLEMEYLEGQSYDALRRKAAAAGTTVPLPVALWILSQALAGLQHAHELADLDGTPLRVVHRDVSPHNVFITYDGNVKVLDFGIAKAADSHDETTTGAVKGKATYMAPEQAARGLVDRRADVFATGVMLWEALAGQRMWAGMSDFEIFLKMRAGAIGSPRQVNPEISPELESICMRAVAMRPDERFATAAELQGALEDGLDATGARVSPRTVAKLMDDLFAQERARVKAEIETQIRREAVELPTLEIPALGEAAPALPATGSDAGQSRTASAALRQRNRSLLRRIGIAMAIALAAMAGLVVIRTRPTRAPADGAVPAPAPRAECTTNAGCVAAHDGAAWICRKDRGRCISLESEDCRVLADSADLQNDRTLWFGTMYPSTGPKGEVGIVCERGVELGRHDFEQIAHGLPSPSADEPPRPIGLVACNDAEQTLRPARHLAEDVGVPAVLGFGSSQEVVDLATQVFLPRRIMVVATENQSSIITSIPHPPGQGRLVFRTTLSSASYMAPVPLIVSDVIEPKLHQAGIVGAQSPMRVALLRPNDTGGLNAADDIFASLRFNGQTAVENRDKYRQFVFDDLAHVKDIVEELVDFRPHVIICVGQGELAQPVLEPLEKSWKTSLRYRPYYVTAGSLDGDDLFHMIGTDAGLRHRFFGVAPPSSTFANARLTMRYNEVFHDHLTAAASPAASYDGFYLLAYATFASGLESPGGPDLAAAVGQLIPPGSPIDLGPTRILEGLEALRTNKRFDLGGIMTRLDFDMKTGESVGDLEVMCVGVDDSGRASEGVDSSLRYDSVTRKLVGALRCP
jgi:hypothetical protein